MINFVHKSPFRYLSKVPSLLGATDVDHEVNYEALIETIDLL